jgi:hypothetical protein
MKFGLFLFFLLVMSSINAQAINPDDSFTFELGLPNATNNKAYRSIMQGLVCISPSYQYALKNGISFGVGLHYSYFAINEFRVQPKIFGGIHSAAAFLKLGYEKFWTERFGTETGLKIGYLNSFAVSDLIKNYRRTEASFVEPFISLIATSSVNSSYRFTIGFPFYGFNFTPETIGISDSNLGYSNADFSKIASAFTISFGYTFYFNGKKNPDED